MTSYSSIPYPYPRGSLGSRPNLHHADSLPRNHDTIGELAASGCGTPDASKSERTASTSSGQPNHSTPPTATASCRLPVASQWDGRAPPTSCSGSHPNPVKLACDGAVVGPSPQLPLRGASYRHGSLRYYSTVLRAPYSAAMGQVRHSSPPRTPRFAGQAEAEADADADAAHASACLGAGTLG